MKSANSVRITISPGRNIFSPDEGMSKMPAVAAIDDRVWLPQGSQIWRGDVIEAAAAAAWADLVVWSKSVMRSIKFRF